MGISDIKNEISSEISAILSSDFNIDVIETINVPHSADGSITFPNLDTKRQSAKLINTCVLYIDIRRSTQLSFNHRPKTVAKLYSAFVRSMTRCARFYGGHVRGIIGDRVMVIFDKEKCFGNAIDCAIGMNSISQFLINKHFSNGDVECGIGIDAGPMLATKTGIMKRGHEQSNYKSLVWLGRPANIASKLTDIANKPEDSFDYTIVRTGHTSHILNALSIPYNGTNKLIWKDNYLDAFVKELKFDPYSKSISHSDKTISDINVTSRRYIRTPKTPPILMTAAVWNGFKSLRPTSNVATDPLFHPITLSLPSYKGIYLVEM